MRPEKITFSWQSIAYVEMGVLVEDSSGNALPVRVPIKDTVCSVLKTMLLATKDSMVKLEPSAEFPALELAQIYEPKTALFIPAKTDFVQGIMALHSMANLTPAPNALDNPEDVRAYFGIFRDAVGKKLIGCRRAMTFKGLVKRKIFFWKDKELSPADSPIFALDQDFDFIIAEEGIFVLHPGQFSAEAIDNNAICKQSADALPAMETQAKFIKFSALEKYVRAHPTAAKLLASIRQRKDLGQMDEVLVKAQFLRQGIQFKDEDGMVIPEKNHELDFLRLLDRRLYDLELVAGQHELYAAGNRTQRTSASTSSANKAKASARSPRPKKAAKGATTAKHRGSTT